MRAIAGLLLFHAALIGAGLGVLRGLRITEPGLRAAGAAIGPAFLAGAAVVVTLSVAALVVGIPLHLWTAAVIALLCAAGGYGVAISRWPAGRAAATEPAPWARITPVRIFAAALAAYGAFGAFAMSRLPTCCDDARIWSLKGLSLFYYTGLKPEVFNNGFMYRAHPVYPLFQPVLEALLFRATGRPELRLFHAELWLVSAAAVWTLIYLVSRRRLSALAMLACLAPVGLLIVASQPSWNIANGFADTTGSMVLAAGALALGLWLQRGDRGLLALSSILLAAAANTKDEDMIGVAAVLIVGAIALLLRSGRARLPRYAAGAALAVALIVPWRIWVAAHHLKDSVTPPLPRALSPGFLAGRIHELHESAVAMIAQALSGYGWIGGVFVAVCIVCLVTRTCRRTAWFYLGSVAVIVAALLWLYMTTPLNLPSFLIPTSMDRTVSAFMVLAAFATGHLLSVLADARAGPEPG